ncbi:Hint domain-containing protein [uncultured Roseobacter sp.]|uniref:Hint domain-containing protein n=1 Tax=uncultured Roseobacter sp. TaxID=114847 RepID=UPI003454DF27
MDCLYSEFSSSATHSGSARASETAAKATLSKGDGGDAFQDDRSAKPGAADVCFCQGTLLEAPDGAIPLEDIRLGSIQRTLDCAVDQVRWISSTRVKAEQLRHHPGQRPILVRKGAVGQNTPRRDVRICQHHRILIAGKITQRTFGTFEVLIAARSLIGMPGGDISKGNAPVT